MKPLDILSGAIAHGAKADTTVNQFCWATVVSVSPLALRFDGEPDATFGYDDITGIIGNPTFRLGERVWCQIYDRSLIVMGQHTHPECAIGDSIKLERASTPFVVPSNFEIAVAFNVVTYDVKGSGTPYTRTGDSVGINYPGVYSIEGRGTLAANPNGNRVALLRHGSAMIARGRAPAQAASIHIINVAYTGWFNAGDFVHLALWQSSGADLESPIGVDTSQFRIVRIG